MNRFVPIMLNLAGKPCLIIGGGKVAKRKAGMLLESRADVTLISPERTKAIDDWTKEGRIHYVRRMYQSSDLQAGAAYALIIAATDSPAVNEQVYLDSLAMQPSAWINVADRPDLSSFIVPSVVRRGKLTLAVSTEGASPSVARKLARELETAYGDEYELYLEFLSELRLKVQSWVKDSESRQQMFKLMVDWDVPSLIKSGRFEDWKRELLAALERNPNPVTAAEFSKRL